MLLWRADGARGVKERVLAEKMEVRLADAVPGKSSGRLEIRRFGVWGTVCDDGFDQNDALVACRMMGLGGGRAYVHGGGVYPPGSGPVWLDEVGCRGTESSLAECRIAKWGHHDCKHEEDVAITCKPEVSLRELPCRRRS